MSFFDIIYLFAAALPPYTSVMVLVAAFIAGNYYLANRKGKKEEQATADETVSAWTETVKQAKKETDSKQAVQSKVEAKAEIQEAAPVADDEFDWSIYDAPAITRRRVAL